MATGWLTVHNDPIVPFAVDGFTHHGLVDTGFSGGVSFPEWLPVPWGATSTRRTTFYLPDGTTVERDVYRCDIELDGVVIETEVIFTGQFEILLGADVLRHFVLTVDYPAGTVELAAP